MPKPAFLPLYLRVLLLRALTSFFRTLEIHFSAPKPSAPTKSLKIKSTLSAQPGRFPLVFHYPHRATPQSTKTVAGGATASSKRLLPAVITVHGGGWIFGTPAIDRRLATHFANAGYVCVSVGYRLAPEHPYPTPIHDVVDAILWIWDYAAEHGIDRHNMALCGLSAGGNMVVSAALRLRALEKGRDIKFKGLVAIYPLLDRTVSREEKWARHQQADKVDMPTSWQDLIQKSYLDRALTKVDLRDGDMSPGLAGDGVLVEALPRTVAVWTCGRDVLMREGEEFRERLRGLGVRVRGATIEGEVHAFDKYPSFKKGNKNRDRLYDGVVGDLKVMLV